MLSPSMLEVKDSDMFRRFVEIKSIAISNTQVRPSRKKTTVVIKHDNGIQETFRAVGHGDKATVECKAYVRRRLAVAVAVVLRYFPDTSSSSHRSRLCESSE